MKIEKIKFQNIHSLKGEFEVDFSDGVLADAGLFAIVGPTGAGKSSLLDVITLSLYGNVPRASKAISKTQIAEDGSIVTRNAREAYAETVFSVSGISYRASWKVAMTRNDTWNAPSQVLSELTTNTILTDKKPEFKQRISEIIGLDYEQFLRSMLLSQGEFSKLIRSPKKERNSLLEKITGVRDYRHIGQAVFEKYSGFKKEYDKFQIRLKEIEVKEASELKSLKKELQELEVQLEKDQKRKKTFEELQLLRENLKKAQVTLEKNEQLLKERRSNFDLEKASKDLSLMERLQKEEGFVKVNLMREKRFATIKEQKKSTEELIDLNLKKIHNLKQGIATFMKRSPSVFDKMDAGGLTSALNKFSQEFQALKNEREQLDSHLHPINEEVNTLYNKLQLQLGREYDWSVLREETQAKLNSAWQNWSEEEFDSFKDELNNKLEGVTQALSNSQELKRMRQDEKQLSLRLQSEKAELKAFEEQRPKLVVEIQTLKELVETLVKNQAQAQLVKSFEEHRHDLVDGVPCALCGALEHPYAYTSDLPKVEEQVLSNQQELLGHKQRDLATLEANLKSGKKNIATLESDRKTKETEIKKLLDTLKSAETKLETSDFEKLKEELLLKNELLKLHSKSAIRLELLDQMIEFKKKEASLFKEMNRVQLVMKEFYEGEDFSTIWEQYFSSIEKMYTEQTRLEANEVNHKSSLEETQKELAEDEVQWLRILKEFQIETKAQFRAQLPGEEKIAKQRKSIADFNEDIASIQGKIEQLKKNISQDLKKDDPSVSEQLLLESLQKINSAVSTALERKGSIIQIQEDDKNQRLRLKEIESEMARVREHYDLWSKMNKLIGDAQGNTFNNFVQDITMSKLIVLANKRLERLNDRYQLDLPTSMESSKADSLMILDRYMGDLRRSVKTLSGGETFLVSLAMAFALGDLASKRVSIDSIFIDEGFGTLDEDSLDQAISILEQIQNEDHKSIGVISHVPSLKERVSTQIRLEKKGSGFSTLEIV